MSSLTFPIVITAALLDSINPCAISVLLISLGFVLGLGYGLKYLRKIGIAYVCGAYLGYLLIGLGILKVLTLFSIPNLFAKAASLLFVLWGVLELIKTKFPQFNIFKIPDFSHQYLARFMQKGSLPASFLTGVLVSLFEFPCTGGPYFSILALLRQEHAFASGLIYLIIYNFIFVLPLILIVVFVGDQSLLDKIQQWRRQHSKAFSIISGVIFIILGLVLFINVQ